MSIISPEWFSTPLGHYVLEQEQTYSDAVISDIFGFNAVQLGLNDIDFLQASRIPLHVKLDYSGGNLRADLNHLPIATQSIDLVVMPHLLEFSETPHQLLREVERILIPEGYVLISGFNPFSLWGLRRRLTRHRVEYPWYGRFIGLPRLKDWLSLLNLEVTGGKLCCYVPPLKTEKWLHRWDFFEAAGDRWWPMAGGVYFVLARKRVHSMQLIMPTWQRVAAKNLLAPAAQRTCQPEIQNRMSADVE